MIRIALTMRVTQATGYAEPRDSISRDWLALISGWGASPLLLPNLADGTTAYLDRFDPDILILTGGDDIGATPERDATERALFNHAQSRSLPVLGVCRGMQMINNITGGQTTTIEGHVATTHGLTMASSWRTLYGAETEVNSYHGLGIAPDGLAPGLESVATDSEGFVEAFSHRNKPVAAIMWHPERAGAPAADRTLIFRLAEEGAFWR